jgi:hypothetical protein
VQSGFRSGYGCVIAILKVLKDVTIALDSKQYCAAVFIDLAKAFDTVDHSNLLGQLRSISVSDGSFAWFANYLSLQQIFLRVQQAFSTLNLVLNTSKTKVMWFGKKNVPLPQVYYYL